MRKVKYGFDPYHGKENNEINRSKVMRLWNFSFFPRDALYQLSLLNDTTPFHFDYILQDILDALVVDQWSETYQMHLALKRQ